MENQNTKVNTMISLMKNSKHKLKGLVSFLLMLVIMNTVNAVETITYYHNDALGSPVAATDEAGNLKWREAYKPYGERLLKQDNGTNDTWFTGKQEDKATGLSYFGARWYDPVIGRFMGIDPVGFKEGNIHSFNRYAYVNNNPYRFVDPDGRAAAAITFTATEALLYTTGAYVGLRALGEWTYKVFNESDDGGNDSNETDNFDKAREKAFDEAGLSNPDDVEISKVDPETGTATEFKGPKGAKVGYDGPHDSPGKHHDKQHISWQSGGKRSSGGKRGNTPYSGPQHPSRAGRKVD